MLNLFDAFLFLFLVHFIHVYSSLLCNKEGDGLLRGVNPLHSNYLVEVMLYLYFCFSADEIGVKRAILCDEKDDVLLVIISDISD